MNDVNDVQNKFYSNENKHKSTNCDDSKVNRKLIKSHETSHLNTSFNRFFKRKNKINQSLIRPTESFGEQKDQYIQSNRSKSLFRMFRKFGNLKPSIKNDKIKRNETKLTKFNQTNRPLITVINQTATKNNIKLFPNDENQTADLSIIENSINRSNQSNDQSINRSNSSINYLIRSNDFNETNLSSLPIDLNHNHSDHNSNSIDRKLDDRKVRSHSETKLTNYQITKQPSHLKSEVEHFKFDLNFVKLFIYFFISLKSFRIFVLNFSPFHIF